MEIILNMPKSLRAMFQDNFLNSSKNYIKTKKLSGRSQDISDIEMLRKVKKYLEEEK